VLVAVTVYVCDPAVEVSSEPGLPDPFESRHVLILGAPEGSVQLKFVATTWPTAYVPAPAGEPICAVGAAAPVSPLTATGVELPVVVAFPSCPRAL